MKPTPLLLALFVCFFACKSPDKKSAGAAAQKPVNSAGAADTLGGRSKSSDVTFFTQGEDLVIPPYGLEKIQSMRMKVMHVPDTNGGDTFADSLDKMAYDSLTLREKFTYNVIHPESWSQNCNILPIQTDQATRIYGALPDVYGEMNWSDRQLAFFKDNRDSVHAWIKELTEKNGRVGANFRAVIVETNATEMIPFLAEAARKETNHHCNLTTLILLMEKNKYPEYMNSSSYKKLAENTSYDHPPFLVYNKANEDLIIQRATNFYNGLAAK